VINIGSTIAFNQITSLAMCALLSSYLVSISCIALKRIRKEPLLKSYFSLGRFGLAINITSILFIALAYVMIFFPPTSNPIPSAMNWSVIIYVIVLGFSLIYYFFKGRHSYDGPVKYVKKNI
jgi:choline transport protein